MESRNQTLRREQLNLNPCYLESLRSLDCQESKQIVIKNSKLTAGSKQATKFDPNEECALEIANYKKCVAFWSKIHDFRKQHNIKPFQPGLDEQRTIRHTYKVTKDIHKVYEEILKTKQN